jgi:hypothetical protein
MEPLNKQERTEAFVKVLALFLLAVILIAIPMYYVFRLPCIVSNEKDELLRKVEKMKKFETQFLIETDSAKYIFNHFEQEKNELDRSKWRLQYPSISLDMEKLSRNTFDDTLKSRLYANVVFSFDRLFNNQDTIFSLKNKITALINPVPNPNQTAGPEQIQETLQTRFRKIVEEALKKSDNNRNKAGNLVGLKEKTFSTIVKELDVPNQ